MFFKKEKKERGGGSYGAFEGESHLMIFKANGLGEGRAGEGKGLRKGFGESLGHGKG